MIDRKETAMTPSGQSKNSNPARKDPSLSRIGHWIRVIVMFLSFGFIFPHAMTEDDKGR